VSVAVGCGTRKQPRMTSVPSETAAPCAAAQEVSQREKESRTLEAEAALESLLFRALIPTSSIKISGASQTCLIRKRLAWALLFRVSGFL
jgi:hypothetical protein